MMHIVHISGREPVARSSNLSAPNDEARLNEKTNAVREHLFALLVFIIVIPVFLCGCSHFREESQARAILREANDFFGQGNYQASLGKYEQILERYPSAGDRVLFEMGILYAYPQNEERDYQKALECFQKIINDYPGSEYRQDSEMMIFQIHNVIAKDKTIAAQQAQIEMYQQKVRLQQQKIEVLEQEGKSREEEILRLQKEVFALQREPADKVLIEKKERRLTLFSKGRVLKTYEIALGGDPNGPKERQGDNKTPEGTYVIDSRNRDSRYHLSLHISYPNENDEKRAKERGVSPGGDIMIHGMKNGFSWVGDFHNRVDWTKGCIAVTDEEIEEIDALVPDGTVVEIRP